ncbi:MAG: O-antigen ligase family protein [Deltaproteobacteria bacterium]|nr:O-antigen ligase family protein [Deltaproteobacteria bacterium]
MPAPAYAPPAAVATLRLLLVLTVVTGGVVLVEPAPYDLLLCLTLAVGPLLVWPSLRTSLALPHLLAALLLLANGISMVLAPELGRGLAFFGVTAYLMVAWALMVGWFDRCGPALAESVLHAHAIAAGAGAALGVAAYFGLAPGADLMLPKGRLQGLFKDANVFGAFVVPAVVLAIARFGEPERRRLGWGLIALVGLLAVLVSYSRGAWINLAIGLAVYFGLRTVSGRVGPSLGTIVVVVIAVVGLGAALLAVTDIPAVREMLEMRASAQGYDNDRFSNQAAALSVALEHPLGIGPGGTETRFPISAHSLYIRAFVENGVLGLWATMGLLILSTVRALWIALTPGSVAGQRWFAVIAASLVGVAVESAVIDTLHWRHLWLLLALAWAPRHTPDLDR